MAIEYLLKGAVEIRKDHVGRFDELVIPYGPCGVHFEMMENKVLWVGLYPLGEKGPCVHVTISARGNLKVHAMEA